MNTLTFDAVPRVLTEIAQELADTLAPAGEILAIRDLWGRVRFIVRERPAPAAPLVSALDHLAAVAAKRLGPRAYAAEDAVLYADESFADIEPLWVEPGIAIGSPGIVFRLIDRQITGQSWATVSEQDAARASHRIAMYSLKGGVGRSTTTAMAAWHLARLGRSVLVLDLDLESPGLSASLLPTVSQPEFGIVDWFVEDAVGQSDAVIPHMSARAPMAQDLPGDVWVVPSHGADPGDFMAKLGRCYLDLSGSAGVEAWDRRLLRLLSVLEADKAPDVVLLDARSGFHDLASAVVTELADTVLLFAIHSEQTWSGYRLLFEHWQRYGVAGIKRGVQSASEVRVRELQEDYPWVNTLMEPLNGKVVPCTFAAPGKRPKRSASWSIAWPSITSGSPRPISVRERTGCSKTLKNWESSCVCAMAWSTSRTSFALATALGGAAVSDRFEREILDDVGRFGVRSSEFGWFGLGLEPVHC